jgi:hypothetical protein
MRAIAPFLAAQWLVLLLVLTVPALTHLGESTAESSRAPAVPLSQQEIEKRLNDMIPLPPMPDGN